jgi:hypothetical protein
MAKSAVDVYYERLDQPDSLRRHGETNRALAVALELVDLVPAVVAETTRSFGRFDLTSIPPIETGCTLAAVLGDSAALTRIQGVVESQAALTPWRTVVEKGRSEMALAQAIRTHLASNQGAIQSKLAKTLDCDGRAASRLIGYMEQAGQIRRTKSGSSYALALAGT